jgi:hypothetical protein
MTPVSRSLSTLIVTVLMLCCTSASLAQHQEIGEKPSIWKDRERAEDSTSLLTAFRRGSMSGHFRYFMMATDNRKGLSDHHANALGGGIRFITGIYKRFQLGLSGYFVYNIGSSDLSRPDPVTGQYSRYEIGLFDVQDPGNRRDIDRLEELFLKFHGKKVTFTLGKQLLNTPFINLQDGRMRPTEVNALWAESKQNPVWKWQAGYIHGISPRSTTRWFRIEESIGIYPGGVNPDGSKSGYPGEVKSRGVLLGGVTRSLGRDLKLQLWNQFADNLFNTVMLQADLERPLAENNRLIAGAQIIRQDVVGNGGNPVPAKTYFPNKGKAMTFGFRAGWKNKSLETSVNYNRITAQGRYLMPREWGRDPFFTFLPRERNEGLGDVHAIVVKVTWKEPVHRITASISGGHIRTPAPDAFRLNKYGMPSYDQLNLEIRYPFKGKLTGLETQVLYVRKGLSGKQVPAEKYVINRVEMSNFNLLLNYQF